MAEPKPPKAWEDWSLSQREAWVRANTCEGKACIRLYVANVNGRKLCRRCQIEFMDRNQSVFNQNTWKR